MTPEEFWKILHDVPEQAPVFFRLYYNDQGAPIVYSMEDLPGKYIEIDSATFARAPTNVRVVDGKLTELKPQQLTRKLQPADTGTACHPKDICVVADSTDTNCTHWRIFTHESS